MNVHNPHAVMVEMSEALQSPSDSLPEKINFALAIQAFVSEKVEALLSEVSSVGKQTQGDCFQVLANVYGGSTPIPVKHLPTVGITVEPPREW